MKTLQRERLLGLLLPGAIALLPMFAVQRSLAGAPRTVQEAQKILDDEEAGGHVGKLLRTEAEKMELPVGELRNEWPLSFDLMTKWKDQMASGASQMAEGLGDDQITQVSQMFNIPSTEKLLAVFLGGQESLHHNNYAAAVTDAALFFKPVVPNEIVVDKFSFRRSGIAEPVTIPDGTFRVSHKAILATDSLNDHTGIEQISEDQSSSTFNINWGNWVIDGKILFQFTKTPNITSMSAHIQPTDWSGYHHYFQEFVQRVIACDLAWELQAARERHLQKLAPKETSSPIPAIGGDPTRSDSMTAGYLGVPWGSPFDDVRRKFAAKAAANYKETRISEPEWTRLSADGIPRTEQEKVDNDRYVSIGTSIANNLHKSRLPARAPFAVISFSDDTAQKKFLFYQSRFYAVINACSEDWITRNGVEVLDTMCRKYGTPVLEFARPKPLLGSGYGYVENPLTAIWDNNSDFVTANLKPIENQYHLNIHRLGESFTIEVDLAKQLDWVINVEGAGFAGQKVGQGIAVALRTKTLGKETQSREYTLGFAPNAVAKKNYFVVVLHVECYNPASSLKSNPVLNEFFPNHLSIIHRPNNRIRPVFSFLQSGKDIFPLDHDYPPGGSDFEQVFFFDVPVANEDLALEINAPERIHNRDEAIANSAPELLNQPQIVDLEQSESDAGFVGELNQKQREMFRMSVSGEIVYASKTICKEIDDANAADKVKAEKQQKEKEEKLRKDLEQKF